MIDLPMNIVLLGSNMNKVGSMGRGRCSSSSLISTGAWIGALISKMTVQLATHLKQLGFSEYSDS
jgi:hypothetical protein